MMILKNQMSILSNLISFNFRHLNSKILFFTIFFGSSLIVFSQDISTSEMSSFRPNTIHGGMGFGGIIATATINYERIVSQNFDQKVVATFVKVGYGTYAGLWMDNGQYTFVQYGFLTGKKANHLEVSAGPLFNIKGGDLNFPIAFGVGYRHQKPGKPFMYRTGISFPEAIHFGMGLSF